MDNVDAIYVGPMDLGVSMELGRSTTAQSFTDALTHIVERCNAHGVLPGIHGTPENTPDRLDLGCQTVTTDLTAMCSNLVDGLAIGRGVHVEDTGAGSGY